MKLAIAGISGRMGKAVEAAAKSHPAISAISGFNRGDSIDALKGNDVVIEFTQPDFTLELANFCVRNQIKLVSGTTGFSDEQFEALKGFGNELPLFWASNMSLGVALLHKLVKEAAAQLPPSYDIEVLEMHHREKVDAPSGTALTLGRAAAAGRDMAFDAHAKLSREGADDKRQDGQIGFASMRGGRVIGEHSVLFAGEQDVITLSHRSQSRDIYAEGAVRAALWLAEQPAGFYGMEDMLANAG